MVPPPGGKRENESAANLQCGGTERQAANTSKMNLVFSRVRQDASSAP